MELIKQLNENDPSMDSHTFDRLVHFAKKDIKNMFPDGASDVEMLEVVYNMLDDIAGYEDTDAAKEMAERVLRSIKAE